MTMARTQTSGKPRLVALGTYPDPLGFPGEGLSAALRAVADVHAVHARRPAWAAPGLLVDTLRAIREERAELLHVFDARYAAVGRWVRRRRGLPVTLSLTMAGLGGGSGWAPSRRRADGLDVVFVSEPAAMAALRERSRADVVLVPPAARSLPWPESGRMARMRRVLRDVRAGRLVVGIPWPADWREALWFRDAVLPMLDGSPLALMFGAPSRRAAHLLFGARGMEHDVRVHTGRLDAQAIAALVRCVDVIAVPSGVDGLASASVHDVAVALAMGGVPIVTFGEADSRVLAHERNAFLVEPDERAFIRTLNEVLALPAVQRHALGEEFARQTSRSWTWAGVAEVYGERFAALVGRPLIPEMLRAA